MGGAVGCVVGGGGDGGEHVKFVKVVTVECAMGWVPHGI